MQTSSIAEPCGWIQILLDAVTEHFIFVGVRLNSGIRRISTGSINESDDELMIMRIN
jgi:hypothetical protein